MSIIQNVPSLLKTAQSPWRRWCVAAILILAMSVPLFSTGFALGHFGIPGQAGVIGGTPPEYAGQFRIFWEAWYHIEHLFYSLTPPNPKTMTYGAIQGMLTSLGDPFASFAEPAQHRLESDTFEGDFGGIGASLALVDTQPTFVEVYVASPAEVAGLQAGDRLLAVDGTEVNDLLLYEIVLLIRGPLDTTVQVDVQRNSGERLSVSIVRQRVELPSLSSQLLSDGIGYVGIHLFSARTGDELARAIQELQEQNVAALVLDLRGNGGGLTGGAIDVLGRLLGHGIAFRELRRGVEEQRHAIPFGEPLVDWPLAVLLDGGTASAAEMVAAALHDYDRGVLIGQRTFGKGSVQGMYQLSDGSSVHMTISHWLSADGYPIEGVGLEPDIVVASTSVSEAEDPVVRHAVDYLDQKTGRTSGSSIAPLIISDNRGKVMV